MAASETPPEMSEEGRALLTESERAILSGDREVTDNYEYKVKSLVRTRVRRRFGQDIEVLRENFPEVFDMIEEEVCNGGG